MIAPTALPMARISPIIAIPSIIMNRAYDFLFVFFFSFHKTSVVGQAHKLLRHVCTIQCTSDLGTYGEEEESVPLHVFEDVLQFVRRRYDQEPEGCDAGDPAMVDVVQRVQKEEEERSAENNARFGQQHGVPDRILVL